MRWSFEYAQHLQKDYFRTLKEIERLTHDRSLYDRMKKAEGDLKGVMARLDKLEYRQKGSGCEERSCWKCGEDHPAHIMWYHKLDNTRITLCSPCHSKVR